MDTTRDSGDDFDSYININNKALLTAQFPELFDKENFFLDEKYKPQVPENDSEYVDHDMALLFVILWAINHRDGCTIDNQVTTIDLDKDYKTVVATYPSWKITKDRFAEICSEVNPDASESPPIHFFNHSKFNNFFIPCIRENGVNSYCYHAANDTYARLVISVCHTKTNNKHQPRQTLGTYENDFNTLNLRLNPYGQNLKKFINGCKRCSDPAHKSMDSSQSSFLKDHNYVQQTQESTLSEMIEPESNSMEDQEINNNNKSVVDKVIQEEKNSGGQPSIFTIPSPTNNLFQSSLPKIANDTQSESMMVSQSFLYQQQQQLVQQQQFQLFQQQQSKINQLEYIQQQHQLEINNLLNREKERSEKKKLKNKERRQRKKQKVLQEKNNNISSNSNHPIIETNNNNKEMNNENGDIVFESEASWGAEISLNDLSTTTSTNHQQQAKRKRESMSSLHTTTFAEYPHNSFFSHYPERVVVKKEKQSWRDCAIM
ncbi:hypothetical protein CYY_005121 [Polysphondylium violaceum]|uniref:Uncharacterized protein n=1 Tax=Polysphondylium violaceum TaxID=133409 RepID=A0A8J4PVC9_9MYCE|nr:hypothetical protein CYY_005121 [Polysphondylium violaceum]